MPRTWNYDGSIARWPVKPGELWTCQHGKVMVRDLYDGLPEFMAEADCVFVDPPWNAGNENSFRTKAGIAHNPEGFGRFMVTLLLALDEIDPRLCFIEIGHQNVGPFEQALAARFPNLQSYPVYYYRKNPCVILRGGPEPRHQAVTDYSFMDELDVIARICREETFKVIADPCMGRGAVGLSAFKAGRQFRGTELNPARLAVMINKIAGLGGKWHVDGARYTPQEQPAGATGHEPQSG